MTRTTWALLAPPEMQKRIADDLCPICGRTKLEFDSNMRVYCTPAHRAEYLKFVKDWGSIRLQILETRGNKCNKCGVTPESFRAADEERVRKEIMEICLQERNAIDAMKAKKLAMLSQEFEDRYAAIMDDVNTVDSWDFRKYLEEKGVKAPERLRRYVGFEVDHIKAIANGGDEWDEQNLQVLCTDCHKKKTAADMKELTTNRRFGINHSRLVSAETEKESQQKSVK